MKKVLVTGATGFVGRVVCRRLLDRGLAVRGTLLPGEPSLALVPGVEGATVDPLGPDTDWRQALQGIDGVIHLAARVHIMNDTAADPLVEFRKVNLAGTARLGAQAAECGVRRLVFVSSVKVNGEESPAPYRPDSPPKPIDPYGISKHEAEQALRRIEALSGLEVAVVRPTLVYGPGVKANFLQLMKVVERGIPLPLGSVDNRRTLVYVENLADALAACLLHPAAAGETFLVGEGGDLSTPDLIRGIARSLNRPARLYPIPCSLLRLAGRLTGKSGAVDRLLGSLTVDDSAIRGKLGWTPPFTTEEGLRETGAWFKNAIK
ncbi:NAD-dependent epimerase/dehydratase family protein [Geomonas sp. Red32]|uniref:NAD-dependent epimerase/dehydratase family protein n=1 Tax=Geomonas sp. Red32 TaxID=2912856 RepID=UPI00202CFE76|nr:NAD-dependent epimerase/dehydratase family protein [Geomonas sp. Red32]MCM0081384.1 NAD-dependent epimerase/dehydratase family protein [Geomonas sp. Red32]